MSILLLRQLLLFLMAFIVALTASQGGISGAFLMIPAQIYILGISSPIISSTNYFFNILGIPITLYRYLKEGRLLMPLTITLAISTCLGAAIGTYLRVMYIFNYGSFKYLVAAVLIILSIHLAFSIPRVRFRRISLNIEIISVSIQRVLFKYGEEIFSFNPLKLALISFIVGIVSGSYGIGGAAFLSPILMTFFGMPAYVITGSTLTSDLIVSLASASSYTLLRVLPNVVNGVCMGLGALLGIYIGTGIQRKIPESVIRVIVSVIAFLIGIFQLI